MSANEHRARSTAVSLFWSAFLSVLLAISIVGFVADSAPPPVQSGIEARQAP
jgi:hypothetical protein